MKLGSRSGTARHSVAVAAIVLGSAFCGAAQAQAPAESERIKDLERKLEKSMQMIEQLSNRLNDLEKGAPAPARVPAERVQQQDARIEALEKNVGQMASSATSHSESGIPLHGFTDVGYERSTLPRDDNRKAGFVLGNLDFFFTLNFGRVKLLAEVNFEVGQAGSLATDLERNWVTRSATPSRSGWAASILPMAIGTPPFTTARSSRLPSRGRASSISRIAAASCRRTAWASGPTAVSPRARARSSTTHI
jgi:hypothetical protein